MIYVIPERVFLNFYCYTVHVVELLIYYTNHYTIYKIYILKH